MLSCATADDSWSGCTADLVTELAADKLPREASASASLQDQAVMLHLVAAATVAMQAMPAMDQACKEDSAGF